MPICVYVLPVQFYVITAHVILLQRNRCAMIKSGNFAHYPFQIILNVNSKTAVIVHHVFLSMCIPC